METVKAKIPEGEITKHWHFTAKNFDTLLPPGPLAEQLEPSAALAGMRHCMTLRKAEGHFHSAWRHIEYAMNQQIDVFDDDLRRKYLGDATWLLGGIIDAKENKRKISPNLYAQALVLGTYMPTLTKRALGQPITPNDCEDIYHSLGWTLHELEALNYTDTSYKSARYAEIIGLAMSARTLRPETLLYPSSPREEASAESGLNHDGYFIKHRRKLPLQSKLVATERVYTHPTKVIYLEAIAAHALARAGCEPDSDTEHGRSVVTLAGYVIKDVVTGGLSDKEQQALHFMTRSVIARYEYDNVG